MVGTRISNIEVNTSIMPQSANLIALLGLFLFFAVLDEYLLAWHMKLGEPATHHQHQQRAFCRGHANSIDGGFLPDVSVEVRQHRFL